MAAFVTAELGVNWNGDRDKIVALLQAAKDAGADAAKLQAFNADALIARRGVEDPDKIALLQRCELTDDDLDMIQREAGRIGIKHFYSVFDPSQIERVLSRGACALKIGHAEVEYTELLEACEDHAHNVKCYISDVADSDFSYSYDWVPVLCCPKYPSDGHPPSMMCIPAAYRGFSSHWQDYRIPAAAALRGAEYIEAHLMLGTSDYRHLEFPTKEPEANWSLSPAEFAVMVKLIREYETWL